MAQTNTDLMREVTDALMADGLPHKAGWLYERFAEQTGGAGPNGKEITRKDYEMFLRGQVLKDDGSIKRTAFGVYQKREHPLDRGVLQSKKSGKRIAPLDECDEAIMRRVVRRADRNDPAFLCLEDVRDNVYLLTARIRSAMAGMEQMPDPSASELAELQAIRDSTLEHLSAAITGITAAIAWQEDYEMQMDGQAQPYQGMQLG